MKRREFLGGGAGAALAFGAPWRGSAASSATKNGVVQEPARELPVVNEADVVVCGAGPAGVAAAVAAAREGAQTLLLEAHGCLGGIWTAGLLSYILDHDNKRGLMQEILARMKEKDGFAFNKHGKMTNGYQPELMKMVLEDLCAEAGVKIQLHTRVCAALRGANNRLSHVITESKSGREAFGGRLFIDCTGDGDLGALAGARFDVGHPETGRTQPMSLMAIISGVTAADVDDFFREDDSKDWATPKDRLRKEMEKGGHSPSYSKPSLFRLRDDLFALMANHEYGFQSVSARDVTQATLRARRELHQLIDGLRSLGGVWERICLVATAEQIGTREGRRLQGLYTVSTDDLREGRKHPDAICQVTFPIDVHSTDPKKQKGIEKASFRAKPYDIPLRALIARDVEGLMMAGRCISGDFIAHSSYRVTGNAVAMGEAAGKVAAVAAKTDRLPQAVPLSEAK